MKIRKFLYLNFFCCQKADEERRKQSFIKFFKKLDKSKDHDEVKVRTIGNLRLFNCKFTEIFHEFFNLDQV